MASIAPQPSTVPTVESLTLGNGSSAHAYPRALVERTDRLAPRDMADALHHISLLHGRYPGVIDHAGNHVTEPELRGWILSAINGFAAERTYLAKIVVAAGPIPSTPGQAETENTINHQRHALEMLAQSDRRGCAVGAAAALVMDWWQIRNVIDRAARRFSVDAVNCTLPTADETVGALASIENSAALDRAVTFGCQQLLSQQHGLWDLLEARTLARGDY